jgi:hypothetical protein
MEGSVRGPILPTVPAVAYRNKGKPIKALARITILQTEM